MFISYDILRPYNSDDEIICIKDDSFEESVAKQHCVWCSIAKLYQAKTSNKSKIALNIALAILHWAKLFDNISGIKKIINNVRDYHRDYCPLLTQYSELIDSHLDKLLLLK